MKHRIVMIALYSTLTATATMVVQASASSDGLTLRGLMDIAAARDDDTRHLNTVNTGDSNFDPLRARIFVEGARGNTQVFIQFLLSPESYDDDRLYGAYVMHRVLDDRDMWLEAGKVPVHDGIWASHTYSNKNPLISVPLAYFWKSNLPHHMMPRNLGHLLANRGRGQYGIVYADSTGARGVVRSTNTILYDNCWNYGALSLGTVGNFEYAIGMTYGPPGAPVASLDTNEDFALHAKLGYAITPGLRAWLSLARGAYLSRDVSRFLPVGKTVNDYHQELVVMSADWRWRHVFVMGEIFLNNYDTPLYGDGLGSRAFYMQAVYTLGPGLDLAARYDEIRFDDVSVDGVTMTWDSDVRRIEAGVAYSVSRDLRVKGVVQATDPGTGWSSDNVVPAAQMSFTF